MDIATLIGLLGAFALIFAAMILGGTPMAFVDAPAALIVIGGTAAITIASFSFSEIINSYRVILSTLIADRTDPRQAAMQILRLADHARKKGVLGLEQALDQTPAHSLLHRGLRLAVDGYPGDDIERILRAEIVSTANRHVKSTGILRRAAEVAPAMGLIGTLVGLVQMLGNLEDPTTIGPSMAVALLTTFYGAILANMVFLPLASKLERNSSREMLINNVFLLGTTSIGRQENPRRLELMLNTILPPPYRVRFYK